MKTIRCIVIAQILRITGDELGILRSKQAAPRHMWEFLPRYFVREEFNKIQVAEEMLQWVDEGKEIYTFFDFKYIDDPLDYEIRQAGLAEILNGIDEDINWKDLFENLPYVLDYKDCGNCLVPATKLVFDVIYEGEGEDVEMYINYLGYLNEQFQFQII